ncbi:hypothetical protein V5799_022047 [Amblyomma americanum]|uniref:Uncharacterized protein n=1 Tax=Amblyomma americanum TaxID=6943 RepID=A0AAQ4FLQ0_AMBAM
MTAIWLAGVASGALMGFVFATVVSAMVAAQGVLRKALQLIEEKKLEGSRKKAMIMAQLCYERYVVDEKEAEFVEDLRNLMKGENLDVKGPPSGVDTRAEQLLVKHVHLAFTYMLSGLIRILPTDLKICHLKVNAKVLYSELTLTVTTDQHTVKSTCGDIKEYVRNTARQSQCEQYAAQANASRRATQA